MTIVVAAGNEALDACNVYPAYVASAITVGATTSDDTRLRHSNFGSCVDIWAPGKDILSSYRGFPSYVWKSGTSAAAPHVAGAVALVLQWKKNEQNRTLSPAEVLAELITSGYKNNLTDLQAGSPNVLLNARTPFTVNATPAPAAPSPLPEGPQPPSGTWTITDGQGCMYTRRSKKDCIRTVRQSWLLQNYTTLSWCEITLHGEIPLKTKRFATESGKDVLTIGTKEYSGTAGPARGNYSGTISWYSGRANTDLGWKLCLDLK